MTDLALSRSALRHGIADVRTAADLLTGDTDLADRRVRALLDGGWRGVAAEAFGEAWLEWQCAAVRLRETLDELGASLVLTLRELDATDAGAREHLDTVASRLPGWPVRPEGRG